jgi:small GTP-binding protein
MKKIEIVILGAGSVGKSAISIQHINNHFVDSYEPTIEDDFSKDVTLNNQNYHITIHDTAGNDSFTQIVQQHIQNSQAFILVYALNDRLSFEQIDEFYKLIKRNKENQKYSILLLGNKCDLESQIKIPIQTGEDKANQMGAKFFQCSALSNKNIREAFEIVLQDYLKHIPDRKKRNFAIFFDEIQ